MHFHTTLSSFGLVGELIFVGEQHVANVIRHSHRHVFAGKHLTASQGANQYSARNKRSRVPSVSCACEHLLIMGQQVRDDLALSWRSAPSKAQGVVAIPNGHPTGKGHRQSKSLRFANRWP